MAHWEKNVDYMGEIMSKPLASALIYIAADRFCMERLKWLAAEEFGSNFCPQEKYQEIPNDFVEIISHIYQNKRRKDHSLKWYIIEHCKAVLSRRSDIIKQPKFKEAFMQSEDFAWDIFSSTLGSWESVSSMHRLSTGHLTRVMNRERNLMDILEKNTECRQCGHEFGCVAELHGKDMRRIEKEVWLRCTKCKTRHFPVKFPSYR